MMTSLPELADLLRGTPLAAYAIQVIPIPKTQDVALVLKVPTAQTLEAWQYMRAQLETTQRWPVLVLDAVDELENGPATQEYGPDVEMGATTPAALIAAAATLDVETALLRVTRHVREAYWSPTFDERVTDILATLRETYGEAPAKTEFLPLSALDPDLAYVALEQQVCAWELAHTGKPPAALLPPLNYLTWHTASDYTRQDLVLLPTPRSWEALAYLYWFGSEETGSPVMIALLHAWHQRYQAELVAYYSTMLHMVVGRRPTTIAEVCHLAWEQEVVAQCTTILPGIALREHARALMHVDRWFLHQRP